ncbi:hypothetical protein [Sphingomonas sp. SRS2]|uniref:hypothetical protein n=1 Tax=Sphingomonas sp. SRS2 TaxID=133190 RepID=UPI0006184C20|nr:hypothetical protein [Sphingomonas sp. SRS2]KKC23860.1 hypothetical protein WP12_22440 [Sphingomonas sp. SRS2]
MMKSVSIVAVSLLLVGSAAGAQVRTNSSPAAAAHVSSEASRHAQHDKLEHCKAMAKTMGTKQHHSHAEMKGTVAQTPMNRQHAECEKMMKKHKMQTANN